MRFLSFALVVLISFAGQAQKTRKIDSLLKALEIQNQSKEKVLTLLELAKTFQRSHPDSSLYYSSRASSITKSIKDDSLLGAVYFRQAYPLYYTSNDVGALNLYNKIDSLALDNNGLTELLIETKIYRSEISKFTLTTEGVYKAKEYLLEGLTLAQEINNPYLINKMTHYISSWHGFIAQEVSPERHLDTARTLALKILPFFLETKDYAMASETYETLRTIAGGSKNLQKMDAYDDKRGSILRIMGDSMKIAELYYHRGSAYRYRPNPKVGLKYLDSAQSIYKKIGYPNDTGKKNLYRDYGYLYSQVGNFKDAYENMQKALVQSYTVYKNQNTNMAQEMEAKYEASKKEQEIALLQAQNETVEAQKKNQRHLMLGGLGLTTAAGIFLFLGYSNRKKTNDKLRELDQVKSNFFANISHEFRTPLSLISGPIEQQLQKEDLTSQELQNLNIAKRNSTRLVTLVDQLLDLSKLESGHFSLKVQKSNLGTFLKSLTSSFQFLAQENKQTYTTDITIKEDTTWFDTDALEKITNNLITNAIKYSPCGETILVQATIKKGSLYFSVKNSGRPISQDVLATLFDRFTRADETTTGSGIGLALTKELVSLHKGTITASSDQDWTTFEVVIPIQENSFTETEKTDKRVSNKAFAKATTTPQQQIPTIEEIDIFAKDDKPILLIVDDNEDLRTYVSSLFTETHTVHTAVNGKEGLEKALTLVPDLIITDLMMPEDDGIILTQNCKTTEATSHIPILMLTAKAGDQNQLLGLETGADAYITKPFNTEILKTTVYNLQETREKLQERFSQEVVLLPKDIATNSADERFLTNLQEVMDKSLIESDFNTEAFAEAVGMSRMQLHRKLKALTGLSATEFIRGQRLKLAAQMLKKSDINVSQVGYAVGFNNHSYFTKCFKEHYGISPSDYSKKP